MNRFDALGRCGAVVAQDDAAVAMATCRDVPFAYRPAHRGRDAATCHATLNSLALSPANFATEGFPHAQ